MSIFYLLPPRPLLGERLAHLLENILPGLGWDMASQIRLTEAIGTAVEEHRDIYIVFREDLPPGETVNEALAAGFGAEPGDEVVEIRPGSRADQLTSQRWRIAQRAIA